MSDLFYDYFPSFEQGDSERLPTVSKKLWETEVDGHPLILRLLAVATTVKCNLFPLIWSKELDGLGEGATGKISQAPLNSQVAFAYKRFSRRSNDDGSRTYAQRLNMLYNAMICELIVLQREAIYNHPNIVKLEGLCWEIVPEFDEIWPVLVFRKAEFGDLAHFLSSSDADGLNIEDLVFICGEVAKGLRVMHLSGIVHGDIKPQNILALKSTDGEAKGFQIADFGYASLGNGDDDLVKLPQSRPWDAPEYSPRWLSISSAKRMDVYSFGLLVFWLLFHGHQLFQRNETNVTVGDAFKAGDGTFLEEIGELKRGSALLEFALRSLNTLSGLDENLRARLEKVFKLSLGYEMNSRASDMKPFVELLCKEGHLEPVDNLQSVDPVKVEEWHGKPDVADFFFNLDACDFRVHKFITKELASMYEESSCERCSTNAAYQLALCHQIGFGVFADKSESELWLHRSDVPYSVLESKLKTIRDTRPPISGISRIVKSGFRSQIPMDYTDAGVLEEALCYYERIASSRIETLGKTHYSCWRLQSTLADMLRAEGKRERAAALYEEQCSILDDMFGPENASSAAVKVKLAKTYAAMHRYEEAKQLYEDVVRYYTDKPDDKHLLISELHNVSDMMIECGDVAGARDKASQAVELSVEYLGPLHPSTLDAKDVLAKAYEMLNETQSAISMREDIVRAQTSILGPNRPETIFSLRKLGLLLFKSGQIHDAKKVFAAHLKAILSSDGKTEKAVLHARASYAGTLARTGEAVEAVTELREIISHMQRTYDSDEPSLIAAKMNLATAFNALSRWDEAEPVWREALSSCHCTPSNDLDLISKCCQGLTQVLYQQENWTDAVIISAEYVDIRQKRQSPLDEDQVSVISMLGRSYARMLQWDSALLALEKEIAWRRALDLLDTAEGLQSRVLIANCYLAAEQQDIASATIAKFFESLLRTQEPMESILLDLSVLIKSCLAANLLEEAEELLKLKLIMKRKFLKRKKNEDEDKNDVDELLKILNMRGATDSQVIFSPQRLIDRYKIHDDAGKAPDFADG